MITLGNAGRAADLVSEIDAVWSGFGNPTALSAALDAALLLVPTVGDHDFLMLTRDGVTWIPVFTSPEELLRFAEARADIGPDSQYLTSLGARLRPVAARRQWGIAVDVAGARPMLFPPVLEGSDG